MYGISVAVIKALKRDRPLLHASYTSYGTAHSSSIQPLNFHLLNYCLSNAPFFVFPSLDVGWPCV